MSTRQIDVQTVCNVYQEADWVDYLLNNVSYMNRLAQEKHLKSCCSCQEHVKQ